MSMKESTIILICLSLAVFAVSVNGRRRHNQRSSVNWCELAFKCGELTGNFGRAIEFTHLINPSFRGIKSGAPNEGTAFDCPPLAVPLKLATSVHQLTPYDISVVGAMGDSITASFGAESPNFFVDLEYRGQSWSIGGDDTLSDTTTLPNIIKQYNPNVKGFSTGTGTADRENSKLNVAVSGGIAQDMPDQAQSLVDKIVADPEIDIDHDWKVVTIFIGGNNLCKYCIDEEENSVQNYISNIKTALDILFNQLPRTFVNLALIMDVTVMQGLAKDFGCRCVHSIACPCEKDEETSEVATQYQAAINALIESENYYRDDFTVVIQPMFKDMELPLHEDNSPDLSYFAPDCFHFSGKGNKEAAISLWNNMLQPVGSKSTSWSIPGVIACPDPDSPYFKTVQNSENGL